MATDCQLEETAVLLVVVYIMSSDLDGIKTGFSLFCGFVCVFPFFYDKCRGVPDINLSQCKHNTPKPMNRSVKEIRAGLAAIWMVVLILLI